MLEFVERGLFFKIGGKEKGDLGENAFFGGNCENSEKGDCHKEWWSVLELF